MPKKYRSKRKPSIGRKVEVIRTTGEPALKDKLSNYNLFRKSGDNRICALALTNSIDSSRDPALSLDGWLRDHSGFNLLNKRKARINFDDPDFLRSPELHYCKKKFSNYRGSELVIILVTHGSMGVTFCKDEAGFIEPSAWVEDELSRAIQFVDCIREIGKLFSANITGVVLNSCFSGAEMVHRGSYIPSTARLVSSLLPGEIPVVGFVGACSDSKITRLYLDSTGIQKSLSRHSASILCQGGIIVDDCAYEVLLNHDFTTLSVLRACGVKTIGDYYKPCGHNKIIARSLKRMSRGGRENSYGDILLRKASAYRLEAERHEIDGHERVEIVRKCNEAPPGEEDVRVERELLLCKKEDIDISYRLSRENFIKKIASELVSDFFRVNVAEKIGSDGFEDDGCPGEKPAEIEGEEEPTVTVLPGRCSKNIEDSCSIEQEAASYTQGKSYDCEELIEVEETINPLMICFSQDIKRRRSQYKPLVMREGEVIISEQGEEASRDIMIERKDLLRSTGVTAAGYLSKFRT